MAAVKVAQLRPTKSSTTAVCNEESGQSPERAGTLQIFDPPREYCVALSFHTGIEVEFAIAGSFATTTRW